MKSYAYVVKQATGALEEGLIWADSEAEAQERLYATYAVVLSVREVKQQERKWKIATVIDFSFQMSLLLNSGIPLRRILELCHQQGYGHIPYQRLYEHINQGKSLHQALQAEGFPSVGLALVQAGELSGTMGTVFRMIADYYKEEQQRTARIKGAMAYPLFIVLLMVAFFFVTVLYILPSFQQVFLSMSVAVPWYTQILLRIGDVLRNHYGLVLLSIPISLGMVVLVVKQSSFQRWSHRKVWSTVHRLSWVMPFWYANTIQVWALLLDSGISLLDTLTLTQSLWSNTYGKEQLHHVRQRLQQGEPFYASLEAEHIGTPLLWNMIRMGEESGEIVNLLHYCKTYYDGLRQQYMERLEKLMEPVLLTVMGLLVGILVISVMYPMFTSMSSITNQL